jgi:hypothetical protein
LIVLISTTAGCITTTVTIGEWSASCSTVELTVCEDVASLAVNNLGRNRPSGVMTVQARPACPRVEGWADGSRCWQVYIPVGARTVCMVVAKRPTDGQYAQVAGDVPALLTSRDAGCP